MNMSNQAAHDRKLGKLHDGLDVSTFDRDHLWHPYSTMVERVPMLEVASAQGVRLQLEDGTELIDAMSSWSSSFGMASAPVIAGDLLASALSGV